jgi:NTP pyrophosphatase (non-canonical NTP hydrolase)
MSDFTLHVHMPSDFHCTISIPELGAIRDELCEGFAGLIRMLITLGEKMSEASDNLTAAVQSVQQSFDTLNTTLQTEMQEIAMALGSANTDQALRDAATDAVARLGMLATSISDMNTTVQNIVP